jgi:hypothetical protein
LENHNNRKNKFILVGNRKDKGKGEEGEGRGGKGGERKGEGRREEERETSEYFKTAAITVLLRPSSLRL